MELKDRAEILLFRDTLDEFGKLKPGVNGVMQGSIRDGTARMPTDIEFGKRNAWTRDICSLLARKEGEKGLELSLHQFFGRLH